MKSTRSYTQVTRAEGAAATKQGIVEAAYALFLEHAYEEVTLAQIATAAGVSHQTVLNHFESKAGVVVATAEHAKVATGAARSGAEPGDVREAIRVLVDDYERMGDANFRWAAATDRIPELAGFLAEARDYHQQWLATLFGDHLPTAPAARRRAVDALHAATDVYSWKLLRRDLGRTRAQTETTMADLVVGILEGARR